MPGNIKHRYHGINLTEGQAASPTKGFKMAKSGATGNVVAVRGSLPRGDLMVGLPWPGCYLHTYRYGHWLVPSHRFSEDIDNEAFPISMLGAAPNKPALTRFCMQSARPGFLLLGEV